MKSEAKQGIFAEQNYKTGHVCVSACNFYTWDGQRQTAGTKK